MLLLVLCSLKIKTKIHVSKDKLVKNKDIKILSVIMMLNENLKNALFMLQFVIHALLS